MKLTPICFTCAKHFDKALSAVRSLRVVLAGASGVSAEKPLVLCDPSDMFSAEQQSLLVREGASVGNTQHPMSWGGERVLDNEMEAFRQAAASTPADGYIMKFDSDVVFISPAVFDRLQKSSDGMVGNRVYAEGIGEDYVQGGCYFLRGGDAARMAATYFRQRATIVDSFAKRFSADKIPEDYAVSRIMAASGSTVRYEEFVVPDEYSVVHLEENRKTVWSGFSRLIGDDRSILYVYDFKGRALDLVGRQWLEGLPGVRADFVSWEEARAMDTRRYDAIWFGYMDIYRDLKCRSRKIVSIHDPTELFPLSPDWKSSRASPNDLRMLSDAMVVTASAEIEAKLGAEGVRAARIPTGPVVPFKSNRAVSPLPARAVSAFTDRPRKNIPALRNLQDRFKSEGIVLDLLTGDLLPQGDYVSRLDACSIYVCCSLAEGGPITAMDAMARGCVVLTTPVGQMPELVEDGKTGFICRSEDEFVARAKELKSKPDMLRRMRRESLRKIGSVRSPHVIRMAVESALKDLSSRPARRFASPLKLDLGGRGKGGMGWTNVNLLPGADVVADILDMDSYCPDGAADEIRMSHTLEHIPLVRLESFLKDVLRKLKPGGMLSVIQTDVKGTLRLYQEGKIDFCSLRGVVFGTIGDRVESFASSGRDLQQHQYMWGRDEMVDQLRHAGFDPVAPFDAGGWDFNLPSDFPFESNEKSFGVKIPNLGVTACRPAAPASRQAASARNRKVFGIGLGRTGTTSLSRAMEILGFKSVHGPSKRDLADPDLRGMDFLCDFPLSSMFKELDARFPGSKFILTTRDSESWLASCKSWWDGGGGVRGGEWFEESTVAMGCRCFDKEAYVRAYDRHMKDVMSYFEGRGDLLVVDICAGDGWEKLCGFLGKPVPAVPFPKLNAS